jgi:GNAT superfamily N-acetyltransferase
MNRTATEVERAIAYRTLPLGHLALARHLPRARTAQSDGMSMVAWGVATHGANAISAIGVERSASEIEAIASHFFDVGAEWGVIVDGDARQPLETELVRLRWDWTSEMPAMTLASIPAAPDPLPELKITGVRTPADLECWFHAAQPGARGRHDPETVDYNRLFIPPSAALDDPSIRMFVGAVDSEPVASSIGYVNGPTVEVGSVAVWQGHRFRGYGTAMTWAAIEFGAAAGCTSAVLRSSAAAYRMYLKMGFTHACTYRTYVCPRRVRR